MRGSRIRARTWRCVSDNQPSIVDMLTKKKAAAKPPRAALKEELPPPEAAAKKPGAPRGRKAAKRLSSSSDSDSDFGSKPSRSVAGKVGAEGALQCVVLLCWEQSSSHPQMGSWVRRALL